MFTTRGDTLYKLMEHVNIPDGVNRLRGEDQLRGGLQQPERPLGELQRELLARLVGRAPLPRRLGCSGGRGAARSVARGELDDAAVDGLGGACTYDVYSEWEGWGLPI